MELNQAIEHAKKVATRKNVCSECRDEHMQLAKWLEELVKLRSEIKQLNLEIEDRERHSIEQHSEIHEYRDKLREAMKKLAAYTDLGVSPEQVALLMKFFKENTSAEKIAVDLKLVADSIKLDDLKKRVETVEKERDSAVRCITETCAYIENTEYGDYCVKNDAPCDKCELLWRET